MGLGLCNLKKKKKYGSQNCIYMTSLIKLLLAVTFYLENVTQL